MPVKQRVGTVVSNKMQKTVVVAVENRKPHPKYGKIMARTKRYKAHDEENKCQEGDRVRITETRPLSRTKRWIVAEILNGKATSQESTTDRSEPTASSESTNSSSETAANSESTNSSSELAANSELTTSSSETAASPEEEIQS